MGAKESKISFLSYEEAIKRVSEKELEQVRKAFKRHAGNNNFISKLSFFNEVLGELVPVRLAEQLYMTCGGSSKGISFRDVFIILVLITNGSLDEKIKFLFYLMSVDGVTIAKEDLENFYAACDGGAIVPSCIAETFTENDQKFSFDEFYQWISNNSEFSAVTRWLLEEQSTENCIKISSHIDTPSFHNSLARLTQLSDVDIVELEKRYLSLKAFSKTGRYDAETFEMNVCPPLPKQFCASFYRFFDQNCDDHIDLKELVCGIALCCRGLTKDRLYACFQMFDCDKDEMLSKEELSQMIDGLLQICEQYDNVEMIENSKESILEELHKLTSNESLTFNEFRQWASTSVLIHEFLLLLSQICHIIFGLKPASQEEEGFIVRRWLDRENKCGLKIGKLYYLISINWWTKWKGYVHFENTGVHQAHDNTSNDPLSKHNGSITNVNNEAKKRIPNGNAISHTTEPPSAIDNMGLLGPQDTRKLMVLTGEGGKLKTNVVLMHRTDYEILPEPVWSALMIWYGGNVPLPRTVIQDSPNDDATLELFPKQLFIYKHTIPLKSTGFNLNSIGINNFITQVFGTGSGNTGQHSPAEQPLMVAPKRTLTYRASFSRKNTVKQIIDYIGQRLKINPDDLRLWVMVNEQELNLIEEEDETVEHLNLKDGGSLLLEVRNRDLSWPEEMNTLVATHNFRERSNTGLLEKGATGLHNLGNTCFMNSAVQCLSNTKPLTQYFCSKVFTYELNKTNPLGMKGILAKRYGDLVLDLWSGIYRSIAPVKLRWTIGRYAPRFNGFQQHDSQELLSFLLDGLHEDVNRVQDKPYVELKDSDGRPDDEVADEAWENHVKRNQSIIVDLFQGQLKSQVRCLHCNHVSVRFDPFIFLSLPLPMESSLHVEIPVFRQNGSIVHRYGLLLPHNSTTKTIKKELTQLCKIDEHSLLFAEVVGATVRSFLGEDQKIQSSLIGYIYAFEINETLNIQKENLKAKKNNENHNTSNNDDTLNKSSSMEKNINNKNTIFTNLKNSHDNINTLDHSNSSESLTLSPTKSKSKTKNISNTLKTKMNIFSHNKTYPVKLVEVSSKSTDSLEVQGIINTSISPNHHSNRVSPAIIESVMESATSGLVVIMNRRMNESSTYFLSWQKYRPMLFGVPLILSCLSDTKNEDIYKYVWQHVSKYLTCSYPDMDTTKKYPFTIKTVDKEGSYCVWCPWYRFCRGCLIPCDDELFGYASSHLAIDWDPIVLHLHYQYSLEKSFIDDVSIEESYQRLREPICLDQCLRDFTKEEELGADETWYCSKCKEHRTIAKKFDIWKLPPILVIHLKRFQLVNSRWVKSNKLVRFPTQSFDPSVYLVKGGDTKLSSDNIQSDSTNKISPPKGNTGHQHPLETGQDVEDISLEDLASEAIPEQIICSDDQACFYDLYAISCHSGMLNGGHYITYAKNPNGKWYCYNDSTCKEIDPSVFNKEAPYMLFYERKHINTIDYLPNIKGRQPLNVQQEEDEFDKEVKKYCSIM